MRIMLSAMMCLVTMTGCMFRSPSGEELKGMPVLLFQETVNEITADIVLANPDGVLNWDDWPSTSFIMLNRIATAWQVWDAEQRVLEAAAEGSVDR